MPEHERILRTAYAAMGRGEIESVLAHCDAAIEFNVPVGDVAGQTYRGNGKVVRLTGYLNLDEAREAFREYAHG